MNEWMDGPKFKNVNFNTDTYYYSVIVDTFIKLISILCQQLYSKKINKLKS